MAARSLYRCLIDNAGIMLPEDLLDPAPWSVPGAWSAFLRENSAELGIASRAALRDALAGLSQGR
jgi:hypothetical protein